jgi:S-DNA-T family DNA segregation ATPase FtsK/SpoIIIE
VKHAQKNAKAVAAARDAQAQAAEEGRLLDARARRDIAGVVCAIAAIALFIITALPASGLVTTWLSTTLHVGLGMGAYILPFVLLLIAASLFARREGEQVPARVAVGLLLMYFALLVLFALYTPGLSGVSLDTLFLHANLVAQGGYVGAGVAWACMLLFGQLVSTLIMVGLIIISLIIIGFSISRFVEKIREHREAAHAEADPTDVMPAMPYTPQPQAAVKRQGRANRFGAKGEADPFGEAETMAIGRRRPHRASASIAAMADAPKAADTSALTRKLGSKKKADSAAKTQAIKVKVPASAAGPHPSEGFELPSMDMLKVSDAKTGAKESEETLRDTGMLLQETLADFGVNASVVGWVAGPTVTLFKVDLPSGVRVSKVTNLEDDIALALAAQGVRIFAPIPGTNYVGIEVPNVKRQNVLLGDVLPSAGRGPLEIAIGKDVEGRNIVSDLAKMPHLLIGGTTGSGKSVAINAMIMSILMRATPAEVRFIMIDPKRVEFTPYNGIPHLYVPVVTECREAASALSWAVAEMERRLKVFSKVGARNINQYNAKAQKGMKIGDNDAEEMPYIVIIIDELADLMMNVGKEVEFSISRLAQLARAAGIHMIVATQRPSTNVVTGLIKANITNRIAFNVASGIDSRVILDTPGAENLIGLGDMLLSKPELPKPQRLQGCFVTEDEINAVVTRLKEQGEPEYHQEILQTNLITLGSSMPDGSGGTSTADDPLIWEAAEIVVNSGLGSTSNIQRRLKVGYSRAGRIMDMLEEKGIVGPPNGSKPREVLVDTMELESLKAFEMNDAANAGE